MKLLSIPPFAGVIALGCLSGMAPVCADSFSEAIGEKIVEKPSVRGDDPDWFFLTRELKHLQTGKFWEKAWEDVAENQSDPVPSIVEFNDLLEAEGIRLLLVPVPAKGAIYPDKLLSGASVGDVEPISSFLERIREAGVSVLDLEPLLLNLRKADPDQKLYCEQDAHFSPYTAERIAGWIIDELGLPEPELQPFEKSSPESLTIVGDQVAGSEWEGQVSRETLMASHISRNGVQGVEPDDEGAILLLGDSHTLVFHEGTSGGMHAKGSGVFDHLSYKIGSPAALVGVRGSGLVQARKQLFYKAASTSEFWKSKKIVVWLFSVREFTQSSDRLIPIPLQR